MTKNFVKTGNSDALVITREMKEHLGLGDSREVRVEYVAGHIVLSRPVRKLTFEESLEDTLARYGDVLSKLD